MKSFASILDFYQAEIDDAEDDETSQLLNRADFYATIYDYEKALVDIEAALAIKESRNLYEWRGWLRSKLDDLDGAIADYETIEEMQPDGSTYYDRIEFLALAGREDEALELAEDFRGLGENERDEDMLVATAMGWAGDAQGGLELLQEHLEIRPGDSSLLNAICWHAGTFNLVDEAILATCTEGVEKADYSPSVLDSRALAYYRLGDLDKAKTDLDSALLLEPELSASRLLRGIIMQELGDKKGGKAEVALALKMNPYKRKPYEAWGFKF